MRDVSSLQQISSRLDFGDPQTSRLDHTELLYDLRARKSAHTPGEGINPADLCGEAFDWQDNS